MSSPSNFVPYRLAALALAILLLLPGASASWAAEEKTSEEKVAAEKTPVAAAAPAPAAPEKEQAAPAPAASSRKVSEIEIRGNRIVSTNTVMSKIRSQKGEDLVQETVNEDIKRLYATGFFQDIRFEVEESKDGYKLIIEVLEKPVIKEITIEGQTIFKEDKLRKEIKILEGQILDRKAVKLGVDAIKKKYSDKGFRFVDVRSDVLMDEAAREAKIVIHITEGGKHKIKNVEFSGVKAFKQKKLIKLMRTRKKSFPFRSGVFKEALFDKDLENLQAFYQQEGYLDVKMEPQFEYNREKRLIFIKILVDEGKHYVCGDIKIKGNELFPESEIWQELAMLPGTTYSQYYLSKDIQKVLDYYQKRGYMDARVVPDIRLNRENGKVDLVYDIKEGDLYFVEKVVVRGNTKTKDIVIRRELRIRPGEKFDGEKIEKSKQRLQNLDYFEDVTYDTEPGSAANRKDLVFRVKEKRTGELSFGGGISSVDRFVAFGEISQKNFDLLNFPRFTGGGQSLALRARVGSIEKSYDLTFTEPYLFDKPVALTSSLYNTYRNNESVDYNESRLGASNTISKRFRDVYSLGTGYVIERVKLDEISEDAPQTVLNFEGSTWISKWRAILASFDNRDNIINPSKGRLITFNGDLAGSFLGGEQDYYMLQSSFTQYWTLFKKHLIEFKLRLGTAQEFGDSDEVPIFDRFYAGGLGSVRGFNYRRVGPKEAGDAVGGDTIAITNLEYTFPIPYLDMFKGAAFVDVGQVDPDSYHLDFGDFSVSVGPGLKVKTPIGPFAFYYGLPIANKDDKNRNGRFEFSLSQGF